MYTDQRCSSNRTHITDFWVRYILILKFGDSILRINSNDVFFLVTPQGDHVISLIDEIRYMAAPAPLISQYDNTNPEQFCNGDNRPADCGQNCMCTHKIDIPLNAVVEIVLVDEGNDLKHLLKLFYIINTYALTNLFIFYFQYKSLICLTHSTCMGIHLTLLVSDVHLIKTSRRST